VDSLAAASGLPAPFIFAILCCVVFVLVGEKRSHVEWMLTFFCFLRFPSDTFMPSASKSGTLVKKAIGWYAQQRKKTSQRNLPNRFERRTQVGIASGYSFLSVICVDAWQSSKKDWVSGEERAARSIK